jgi:hypothetical protein
MSQIDRNLEVLGEFVDRLVTVDLWCKPEILPLYQAARNRQNEPLCLLAARRLKERIDPGRKDVVLFVTGFISPTLLVGEQDGPVGSACLARALAYGFNVRPIVVTDEDQVQMVKQTFRGAGFNVFSLEAALRAGIVRGKSTAVIDFPKDENKARAQAKSLFNQINPVAVIAIERPSGNEKSRYHGIGGHDITDLHAKTDYLLTEAKSRSILTIGVADGGNELGSGLIADAVKAHRPNNARCTCPCGGSIAAHTQTDILVFAAISDWGAFGIEACLAALQEDLRVLHSEDVMRSTLWEATYAGLEDGMAGWVDPGSDGISWNIEANVVNMLRTLVDHYLSSPRGY